MNWKLLPPSEKGLAPYLSISAANTYLKCPLSWKFQYVDKLGKAQETTAPMALGIALHEVMSRLNQHRIETGAFPDQVSLHDWLDRVMNDQPSHLSPAARAQVFPQALGFVSAYIASPFAAEQPVMVEQAFLIEADSGMRLYGFIDVSFPESVWDYKFTAKPVGENDYDDQIYLYAWAYRLITSAWPTSSGLINFVKSTGQLQSVEKAITPELVMQTLDKLQGVYGRINSKQFGLTPGSHCRWCNFEPECRKSQVVIET